MYGDGRFFDVEKDVLEQNPLALDNLEEEVSVIRRQFQEVLRRMPAPVH